MTRTPHTTDDEPLELSPLERIRLQAAQAERLARKQRPQDIHWAVESGKLADVGAALALDPSCAMERSHGTLPLMCAISKGFPSKAKILFVHTDLATPLANSDGAPLNFLGYAAERGASSILRALIDHLKNAPGPFGTSLWVQYGGSYSGLAVHSAVESRQSDALSILLEAGADAKAPGHRLAAPIFQAVANRDDACCELLAPTSELLSADARGNTLLMTASYHANPGWCRRLAELPGYPIDAVDADGNTALMLAASRGHGECVEILAPLSSREQRNCNHHNAYSLALAARDTASILHLQDTSNCWDTDERGRTGLMIATSRPDSDEHAIALADLLSRSNSTARALCEISQALGAAKHNGKPKLVAALEPIVKTLVDSFEIQASLAENATAKKSRPKSL